MLGWVMESHEKGVGDPNGRLFSLCSKRRAKFWNDESLVVS